MAMMVRAALAACSALGMLLAAAVLFPGRAQTPPNAQELRIYAGLHAAAANGDVGEIERLIAEGEKPDIQDANSRTPLIVAAFRRQHGSARALIRLGANVNARDAQHYDILTIAAAHNDLEMLNLALDGGADFAAITSPYNGTALIAAAHRGHVDIVRALIAAKAPLDLVNRLGWTALMEAVVLGNGGDNHVATVEALVKAGANVDIADRQGTTALEHARKRRYAEIVKILEAAGAR
jgi:ankyrin repeat protein